MKPKKTSLISALIISLFTLIGNFAIAQNSMPQIILRSDKAQQPKVESSEINRDHAEKMVHAAKTGQIDIIKQMIQNGFHIDTPSEADGTALIIAVQKGNQSMVKELLELGADVNAPSRSDGNPLINAALRGNLAIAKILISAGADVNAYVYYDETPLISASQQGHLDLIKYLVENGANVNLAVETPHRDASTGLRSPLSVARDPDVIAYLKNQGAL